MEDPNAFLSELELREAVPLAIKPVTLAFLLNTDRRRQGFPASQAQLYAEGCRLLCEETSESRRGAGLLGDLTADQRLAVAARIAAITVFCNRYAIWTGVDRGDVPTDDILLEDLIGDTEGAKDSAVAVSQRTIRETLDTGLFSSRGLDRIGWAHQTYAEFLAARFLVEHGLPADRIMALILHPDGKIVPQLRETAAWLASMVPEVFRCMVASDPVVLLRSDVATADVKDRADLVGHLLRLCDQREFLDRDFTLRWTYHKLKHAGLAEQLRPYIRDKGKGIVVRRVAIDIAEACEILSLQEDLVEVALDETDSHAARVQAACAISQIGHDRARAMLKPLAMGQAGDDPDDELKGCGLICAWPRFLTAAELFAALSPPKQPHLFGMYQRFLRGDIADHLQPCDLPLALKWVEAQAAGGVSVTSLAELAEAIAAKALDHLDNSDVRQALAAASRRWLRIEGTIIRGRDTSTFRTKLAENVERRRRLVEAMLPLFSDSEDGLFLICPGELIDSGDTLWLIDRLHEAGQEPMQRLLATLIARVFDRRDLEQLEAVILAGRQNRAAAEELSWLLEPVELDSPRAQDMRAQYDRMKALEERRTARPRVDPPPERRIAVQLERFESGDMAAFWQLNRELTLEPDSTYYGNDLEPDLTVLPGWKTSDAGTRARIIAAAKQYLKAYSPEAEKWLGTGRTPYAVLAGYRALVLLLAEAATFVSSLPHGVWEKWAPITLAFPLASSFGEDKRHQHLMTLAYERAPNAVLNTLLTLIDAENQKHGTVFVLQRMESVWDQRLTETLLAKVADERLKPGSFGVLLGALVRHDVPCAREIAASSIGPVPPSGGEDRERAKVAATALLVNARDAGWEIVWPAVQQDIGFGCDVFSRVADVSPAHGVPVSRRLTEDQLTDLFVWLARNVSFGDDPEGEVSSMQTLRWWRAAILDQLKGRGTAQACEGIRRAMTELPHLDWLKWQLQEAQEVARQRSWVPLEPKHLLEMVAQPHRRIVQTGEQLLEVLIESLKRLEVELQGETPAAIDLWQEVPFRPRSESRLSDYIKRHLERDIGGRGIVVNREVEIRRGAGSSPGERTDIHVDAVVNEPSSGSHDRISAIIEVKGCWNRDLKDAMETQLAERYLKDNRCPFGLYVVGWFASGQWDAEDYRKRQAQQLSLAEAQAFFDDQARKLSSGTRRIKALVLNAALR
ncbi:MAG: hypothetical protein AAB225_24270 [Acidobacteriota bacterium]